MAEVRTMREGTLRWVRASGSGTAWATASAPASGLMGYVRSFSTTSAQTTVAVMDRGTPTHKKLVSKQAPNGSFSFAWTGTIPTAVSGSGASVPMYLLEHKAVAPENGSTGVYHQFYGVTFDSLAFAEGENEDVYTVQFNALAMMGPTGSGYLG